MSITSTTIHNSCKKLAQLNRVIEYLGSYIEEVHFQTVAMERNVDAEFQTIFKNYEKNANLILDGIKKQERAVIETIQVFYNNRIEKENQKIHEKKQKILEYIKSEEIEISNKVQNLLYTILLIQQNVQDHISAINNENYTADLQSKIKELEKAKKIKFKDFDKEKNEKILTLKENSEKKMKDIEKHFLKVKNDLIISYESENPLSPSIKNKFHDIISKINILKSQISEIKKNLNSEQIIASQNFSGFKARLHSMTDQFIDFEKEKNDELLEVRKQNEVIYNQLANELKEQKNKKNSLIHSFDNEFANLQNEQRMTKSQIKASLTKFEKQNNKKSSGLESEIDEMLKDFQKSIQDLEESLKKNKDKIKSKILLKEEEIKNKNAEFEKIELSISNSKTESLSKFSEEIEKFKEKSENEKEKEREEYNNKCQNLRQLLENQSNDLMKLEEANQKIKDLQEELNIINSKFNSEINQIDINPPTENNNYENEMRELSEKLDKEYYDKHKSNSLLYDSENSTFSEEEEKFKEKLEKTHQEEIKKVSKNFKDEDFKEKIAFYEKEYKKFNQQLQSIQVIDKEEMLKRINDDENGENSLESLEKKKNQLIENISKEREVLIAKFKNEEQIMIENQPNLIDQNSIQIDKSKYESIKLNSEKCIQNYQLIIDEKEKELLSLQEENKKYLEILNGKNYDDDDNIQKLRLRLSSDQQIDNDKIRSELERFSSMISNLRSQIDLAQKQNESELSIVQANNDKDHKTFREAFQEKSNYRKQLKGQFDETYSKMQQKYEEEKVQNQENYDKKTKEMQESIIILQNEVNSISNGQFKIEEERMNSLLTEKVEQLKNDLDSQIEKMLSEKVALTNQSVAELSAAEERRNGIIESVNGRPMRDEEKSIIEKLSIVLDEETEKLKKVGMEFLDMRESLAIREKQINQRFGNLPQVLESRNQKRRGAASAFSRKKPLPPLSPPNLFV